MIHIDTEQASEVSSQETAENASPKMDPALKAKWVAALRSGEYKQGQLNFERNGKFCCLGVLCKIAGQPTGAETNTNNWNFIYDALDDHGTLNGKRWPLAYMNDGGKSFAEIADYIEAIL